MSRVPMTQSGLTKLQAELEHLKHVERPNIIRAIAEARALGDLKENAEYHAAKERQSFIEGRISELEGKISLALVIDVLSLPQDGKIVFGVTVELQQVDTGRTICYQIVGDDEADIKEGKVSISSPISRALIGKFEGDIAQVHTPSGVTEYEIVSVRYL